MPTLDDLLDSVSEDLRDADIIGLAGYHLREIEDENPFSTSQIRGIVDPSLRQVPQDSIGAYPSQLRDEGYFQSRDNQWDLTQEGLTRYEELVSLRTSQETPRDSDDLFITADPPNDDFYEPLVEDINQSYRYHIYDATMVLSRKLLENLLIEVLRLRLGTDEHLETFYIPSQGRFQPFSELIENFSDNIGEFRPYNPDLDASFVNRLDQFRTRANANAHSIQVNLSQGEIEALSDNANELARTLFRLREQARLDSGA